LAEFFGNEHLVKALEKMLQSRTRPHAILFFGPSGCGKTTLGRIIAHTFGSDDYSILEYNAANTNGIATVREIAANVGLSTLGGKPKTYIIDECHELTGPAQEALLKVLEEPPEHCYFILCTTAPANLIDTIRNRCTKYEVSKLGEATILKLLENACQRKGFNVNNEVLQGIAAVCDGSARAALVLLEAVKDIDNVDDAFRLLVRGTDKDGQVIELCKLMYGGPSTRRRKWQQIIQTYDRMGENPEAIRKAILTYLYKKLASCTDEAEALDLAHLVTIFSANAYYGGKSLVGALVTRAIFSENPYAKPV